MCLCRETGESHLGPRWMPGGCQGEEDHTTGPREGRKVWEPQDKGKNPPKVVGFQNDSNFMQIYSNYYGLIISPDCFPVPVDKSHHADHA